MPASTSHSIYSVEYQKSSAVSYLTFIFAEVLSLFSSQFLILTPRAPVNAYKLLFTSQPRRVSTVTIYKVNPLGAIISKCHQ